LSASEKSAGESNGSRTGVPAVLLGGSEDTRLLLRGLLRLHRHRVLLETQARDGIDRLPRSPEPKVLILDAGPEKDGVWADELFTILQSRDDLRALVILPSSDPAVESRARRAGARTVLVRPFAIREFVEAVESAGAQPAPT
jgi:DNA-binding NarL/FixJ family response regulator